MSENWHDQIVRQNREYSQREIESDRQFWAELEQERKDKDTAAEILALKNKVKSYEELLSRPMKEIAKVNSDFKKTYEQEQNVLAQWILGQRAYKETAIQLGMSLDMTAEQVQKMAAPNFTAVLENRTQHGNDASSNPTLAVHASAILALRKKNGKA